MPHQLCWKFWCDGDRCCRWNNSIDIHNLKNTTYVGDGDLSSFGCVSEALEKRYGSYYHIEKEDCIKGWKRPQGSTKIIAKVQNCLMEKLLVVLVDSIYTNSIYTIYDHMICDPKHEMLEEQHKFCPKEQNTTWCKCHENKAKYSPKTCLPELFRYELLSIFERLSSNEPLDSWLRIKMSHWIMLFGSIVPK